MALTATGVAAAPLARAAGTPRAAGVQHYATGSSLNWSGYVKTGSGISGATGTFTVPKLLTTYNGYSSMWVGVDGASSSDKYLIQTGIEADVVDHKASYYAWWELITPSNQAPEVTFRTVPVKPGDSVTAAVRKVASGSWTMTFTDNTTKRSASHKAAFKGTGRSAEWIVEDTDVNGTISSAPDWQSVTWRNLTAGGANPKLKSSQALEIVSAPPLGGLLGGRGVREVSTSAPSSTGNAFKVTWLAAGTRTRAG